MSTFVTSAVTDSLTNGNPTFQNLQLHFHFFYDPPCYDAASQLLCGLQFLFSSVQPYETVRYVCTVGLQ